MLKHIIFVNTKVFLKSKLINTQKNVLNQPEWIQDKPEIFKSSTVWHILE